MISPFPGMDPYLEEPNLWSDVHLSMVIAMRGELNASLPKGYIASADKYVWIHEPDAADRTRLVRPDTFVVKQEGNFPQVAAAAAEAPNTVVLPAVRREGNKYLKIVDVKSRRLVTVIEMLSPSNKEPGPDREGYLTKRIDYLTAGVNLVEIDLLRAGPRIPLGDPLPTGFDYYVLVCRAEQMPKAGVWSFTVRDPLPQIPVPLGTNDADVMLDLRRCLDRAYSEGRYNEEIDYTQQPEPPLSDSDFQWAANLVSAKY